MTPTPPPGVNPASIQAFAVAQRRYRLARGVLLATAIVGALVIGTMLVILMLETHRLAGSVDDCVSPGGECYERSVKGERDRSQSLRLNREQVSDLDRVLSILETEYPEAAQAVADELEDRP